ncbi:alpha/beta fold hydrolase [Ilumatobacter sp.]|uniref:alpha/beta fold hydrolase n=1 Tax=Ilumatobacter sp. TaxID=1967498 RepID=UPI003B52132E
MTAPSPLPTAATWRRWGIDPSWSRTLEVAGSDGVGRSWHLLDTGPPAVPDDRGATVVCVHGNPTWSVAWAPLLRRLSDRHRVVAVDQLSMGFSERVAPRRYVERVRDLGDLLDTVDLDPSSPLVIAAHDWGGAIAMGWAVDHPRALAGLLLCNTGIAVPERRDAPLLIRLAASAPLRDLACRRTRVFVDGTALLSGSRISSVEREALRAPYDAPARRGAIADFVGDVPLREGHPSDRDLERVADLLGGVEAPVLLAWGAHDPVFDDDFAADLALRFRDVGVHRFADAGHLVMMEADVAGVAETWLGDLVPDAAARPLDPPDAPAGVAGTSGGVPDGPTGAGGSLFAAMERRRGDHDLAVVDLAAGGGARGSIDFADFARRVDVAAGRLRRRGVRPGDRVAVLIPPGIELLVAVYALWRAGAVTVVADRGLGLRGLGAAVSSTRPRWTIGPRRARLAAWIGRWAPRSTHLDVGDLVADVGPDDPPTVPVERPVPEQEAAILFTSGATGPAKGVSYLHGQLVAQRDALAATYSIGPDDRLVAAFAPFALYGPALGVPTALADCDVTTPGELTARALADACERIDATIVFASPAALANVVATAERDRVAPRSGLRLVLSAGAPVPSELLRAMSAWVPGASLRTPYGMTEALPVADIDLAGIAAAEAVAGDSAGGGSVGGGPGPIAERGGVCVGQPVDGAEVRIAPLGFDATAGVPEAVADGLLGEVLVRAPWVSRGYVGRWGVERLARPGAGWHRTGDVGHLDGDERLWIEGRAVHVIDSVDGPVTPVPIERAVEAALAPSGAVTSGRVAAVGVGPAGGERTVIVIERRSATPGLADVDTVAAVRSALDVAVAAVLVTDRVPVDVRHDAKIDRAELAGWATRVLAGASPGGRRASLRRGIGRVVRRVGSR